MRIKCGVVGLGMGAAHARSISQLPDAELVAVADLDEGRRNGHAEKYGARPYKDWQSLLEGEDELDAIVLATPAVVRREPIEAFCARKLALFCEKPPAISLEEGEKVSNIIEDAGVLNTVGFMYRWSPLAARFRELVFNRPKLFARGVVAWPVFSWVYDGHAPKNLLTKAASGGPLIDQAIHYQDVLRYITGDEPLDVQAYGTLGEIYPQNDRDSDETTAYILRHQSGMLSTHIHNWSHAGTILQLQVVGKDYELTWHMNDNDMRLTGKVEDQIIEEASTHSCHFEELKGFIEAVRQNEQSLLRSPYRDACQSMSVCLSTVQAVATGVGQSIDRV